MLFIGIAVMICVADLTVKYMIEKRAADGGETSYMEGRLLIQKHHNKGVFLNFMEKIPNAAIALSGIAIGIMIVLFGILLPQRRRGMLKLGFAFALGGAAGNFIDRVMRGYVVDFLRCPKVKRIKNIIFNVADIFIFLGGILISIAALFEKK